MTSDADYHDMLAWPSITELAASLLLPRGYEAGCLSADDVGVLIEKLRTWYPDIAVGAESCHLRRSFYAGQVHLAESVEPRNVCALVARWQGTIVAMCSVERDTDARSLHGRLAAVDPHHRNSGVMAGLLALIEAIARVLEMEILVSMATLRHPFSQALLERAGYRLAGIVPAYDRDVVEPGVIKRVWEAMYVKIIAPPERLLPPRTEHMAPSTRALFALLFPELSERAGTPR